MSDNVIDDYLTELSTRLPGPRKARSAIVAEIGDGMADAIEHYLDRGLSREDALRAAVADIGDPEILASEFAPVVTASQIHRYGIGFLVLGPLVGVTWVTAAVLGSFDIIGQPIGIVLLAALAVVVLLAGSCAWLATAATGCASRWLDVRCRSAATALLLTASGAAVIDSCLLGYLLLQFGTASAGEIATVPVALAGIASVARLGFSATRVPRLTRVRALLA